MFDKLIESNSVEAEFKPRRKFFMMSSVVVGILFLSAVVVSLYAQNIDLGTDSFELVEMIAPVAADAPEPEPPRQQQQQQNDQQQVSELPNRQDLIARVDQVTKVPDQISTNRFDGLVLPEGKFTHDPNRADSNGSGTPGASSADSSSVSEVVPSESAETKVPPPAVKVEPKKRAPQTKGVVNGFAIDLPKPAYPPAAKAIRLSGVVNVQVLIDEAGNVVSAKAVDGPSVFKSEAERSARRARFKPTYLGDDAVKVTGVIVYKFTL